MAFTFTNYAALPVPRSPMQAMLENALSTYQNTTNAKYLKREKEGALFAQKMAPIAALAGNPNFTGFNPEVNKQIGNYIGSNLPGFNAPQTGAPAGFPSGEDIMKGLTAGAKVALAPGGKSAVGRSRLAGTAQLFGIPAKVSNILAGPEAAAADASFQQYQDQAIQAMIRQGKSEAMAKRIAKPKQGELAAPYLERMKLNLVNDKNNPKQPAETQQEDSNEDEQKKLEALNKPVMLKGPDGKMWPVAPNKVEAALKYIEEWKRSNPNG